jgi:HEAT repeat protein
VTVGLQATFQLLGRTENEAAVPLLLAALDSPAPRIQQAALRAIFERRSPEGLREVIRRRASIDDAWKKIIQDYPGRFLPALRDAVLSADPEFAAEGCRTAKLFREYDLIPTLIVALEDETNPSRDVAAQTLTDLADELYQDLAGTREDRRRRDPQISRRNATSALESSLQRFGRHQRLEPVEAFLQLATRDNAELMRILADPRASIFTAILGVMHSSERPGVIRLLLGFLDDSRPPSAGLSSLFRRTDRRTIDNLLKKVGSEPSVVARTNLRQVETIAWINDHALLEKLDAAQQHSVVKLAVLSGMKRADIIAVLEYFVVHGKPAGRRSAVQSLGDYNGADVNTLVLKALRDEDPHTKAHALGQLRRRGIPGALTTLIEALDSPLRPVNEAARANLEEFSFRRFLPAFELLEEDVRRTTGGLVRKVDLTTAAQLREEMESPQGKRRMRALKVVMSLDMVAEMQADVIARAADEDHLVRVEAVRALAMAHSLDALATLQDLQSDSSFAVREAVAAALEQFTVAPGSAADASSLPPLPGFPFGSLPTMTLAPASSPAPQGLAPSGDSP